MEPKSPKALAEQHLVSAAGASLEWTAHHNGSAIANAILALVEQQAATAPTTTIERAMWKRARDVHRAAVGSRSYTSAADSAKRAIDMLGLLIEAYAPEQESAGEDT